MGRRASIAGKRPANVTISATLLARAKALKINLSQALEARLEQLVREEEAKRWLEENRKAIEAYNARVEREGLWSEGLRAF